MDLYLISFDLKPAAADLEVVSGIENYLGALKERGDVAGYRITRRKLGLGDAALGEFLIYVEFEDLAQLDRAFTTASTRADPIESLHAAVNQSVIHFRASLYRDFPDPHRKSGEERF